MESKELFDNNEEIDLQSIINTLLREKLLIFFIVVLSSTISTIFSFTTKPVWVGGFDIVVKENTKNKATLGGNSLLGGISSLTLGSSINDEKQTQILILKSPLVLKPVYEFVHKYNEEKYPNIYKNSKKPSFEKWLQSDLKINFKKESSVLDVKYQSTDKDLIIQTLNLISSKYKAYSKRDKEKNLNKTIQYLETQSNLMREKFFKSQKKYNEFTISNGLGDLDGFVGLGISANPLLNGKIDNLDLPELNNILDNKGALNIGERNLSNDNSAGQRYSFLFSKLERYEAEYIDLTSKLKPNSLLLQNLKEKIDNLKSSLKRPNEILVEYRNLKDEASRNDKILQQIENNLEIIKLQKVRTPDAWELISEATIDDNRVFPHKKKILFLSLITSSIIGALIGILKEKISGKIFEANDFKRLISFKHLDTIKGFNSEYNSKIIIKNLKIKNINSTLGILYLSENFFKNEIFEPIKLSQKLLKHKFLNYKNLNEIENLDYSIIVVSPGMISFNTLEKILNYLKLYNDDIQGWIIFEDDLESIKKI